MLLLGLLLLGLEEPDAAPSQPEERGTVVGNAEEPDEKEPVLNSRIGRERRDSTAPDPIGAMVMREWANCIVRTRRRDALALLSSPLNSPEQQEIVESITSSRFGWRTPCLRARMMWIDNLVLRGAIAEALYRWEDRRGRRAGPLSVPPPAPKQAQREDEPALLAEVGRCVTLAAPEGVRAVMATRPASGSARSALTALGPEVSACLRAAGRPLDLHPLMLRGVLGEPFYLHVRGLLRPARSPEG